MIHNGVIWTVPSDSDATDAVVEELNDSPLHVVYQGFCINVTETMLDDLMWQDHQRINDTDITRLQQYVAADILTRDCINRLTAV